MGRFRKNDGTEQDVIAGFVRLAAKGRAADGVSLRELARELELNQQGRRTLKKLLSKLKHRGEIEELNTGRYRLAGTKRAEGTDRTEQGETEKAAGRRRRRGEAKPAAAGARDESTPRVRRAANEVIGRVVAHRDGFGFVLPEEPIAGMEGDLFLPPNALGDAMHGDRVLARIEKKGTQGRFEGRVVQILKRAHPTVVGVFHYARSRYEAAERGNYVIPFDTRLTRNIVIPPGEELTPEWREKLGLTPRSEAGAARGRRATPAVRAEELEGMVVNVELTRFPRGGVPAAGRVVEVLGRVGEMGVDVEIIIRKHHLPCEFPDDVLRETEAIPQQVSAEEVRAGHRRDFRHLPIVTIDGESARDFDDAVYVERLAHDRYALQVHIADVAHYVRRGSALDREARLRGTSVYFPDRAVPMLPEPLSSGICSLNPRVDRLVMSVLMEFDGQGKLLQAEFAPGVIRSVERMTYTSVNKVLEGDPEASARYAALAERFRLMRELALILNAKRERRGAIDFDLPEPVIEFDDRGRMRSIVRSERNIAHRIIEEFMLAANEAVAGWLLRQGIAFLHRVHEPPDPKKILEFEALARAFGYTLGVAELVERRVPVKHGAQRGGQRREAAGHRAGGQRQPMVVMLPERVDIRPQHYQNLVRQIEGKPEERILSYLMLRSLKQARYSEQPLGHFALACREYTHFTSPIRRYPDLVVHRILKWALAQTSRGEAMRPSDREAGLGPYRLAELEEIAQESSEAERRADAAERDLMDWKTAQLMEEHLGEEYEALVISVHKFGCFVELLAIFVEGLVPIDSIEEFAGERCFYREQDRAIVAGRGRVVVRLGDRVRVRTERVDPIMKRVEFALLR